MTARRSAGVVLGRLCTALRAVDRRTPAATRTATLRRMTVLSTQQLLARLGTRHALSAAVADGRWTRVLRGAYADEPVGVRVRARAARLVLPPHAVVAGTSALWLCGLDELQDDDHLEVLVPRGAPLPRRSSIRAREGLVEPMDVGLVGGVPCLRPARAAVDVVRRRPLAEGVAVLDAVLRSRLATTAGLDLEVRRAHGARGVLVARQALTLCDGRAESPPESLVRVALVQAGLHPVPQHEVRDRRGTLVARVDLAFPEHRVAIEYDGRDVHARDDAFVRDRQRQNALVALGWSVLRFTSADLRRPAYVVREVLAVLARTVAA